MNPCLCVTKGKVSRDASTRPALLLLNIVQQHRWSNVYESNAILDLRRRFCLRRHADMGAK